MKYLIATINERKVECARTYDRLIELGVSPDNIIIDFGFKPSDCPNLKRDYHTVLYRFLQFRVPKMIEKYTKDLMAAKSIHFDRWNSRLPYIHYAYKPHEVCAEMEHVSGTTAKVRAGAKLQTMALPTKLNFTGKTLKSFAGIPVLKFLDEAKRLERVRLLKKDAGTQGKFVGINPKTGKKIFKITGFREVKVKKINYKTK